MHEAAQALSPPSPQKSMFRTMRMSLKALSTLQRLSRANWGFPQLAGFGLAALRSEGALSCAQDQTLMLPDFHSIASRDSKSATAHLQLASEGRNTHRYRR